MKLPYFSPDDNFHLNLGLTAICIQLLAQSSKGTLKLNNDRLHIYTYLIKNPVKLNLVLSALRKTNTSISRQESYSITSISPNVDPLFDRGNLKAILTTLVAENLVDVVYKKKEGFFYKLSDLGWEKVKGLEGEYFLEIRLLCEALKSTLSTSTSSLNQALNQVIRKEFIPDGK